MEILKIKKLAARINCGMSLTQDLLLLAGGDEKLVIKASEASLCGVNSVKAFIINERFKNIEIRRK